MKLSCAKEFATFGLENRSDPILLKNSRYKEKNIFFISSYE